MTTAPTGMPSPIDRPMVRGDFPWLEGAFEALPGFAEFKPLFDCELPERVPDWEEVYAKIQDRLSLYDPDGPVAEFLLHVEDDRAWFRWSDTPFDR